ncbi:MAG: SH3 domain-containing protein [bacterium]|nr:SH3 domain-containing protein [bacterium]
MKGMGIILSVVLFFGAADALADMVRVTVRKANVRAHPGSNHKILKTMSKDDTLPVTGSDTKWWEVRLEDGRKGWIYKQAVALEKATNQTQIQSISEAILGTYLKWSVLNEVYIEEYQTARLDVMVHPEWSRLSQEEQKNLMMRLAREFASLCEADALLKKQDREQPYVAFFDRYNTLLGKANQFDVVFSEAE